MREGRSARCGFGPEGRSRGDWWVGDKQLHGCEAFDSWWWVRLGRLSALWMAWRCGLPEGMVRGNNARWDCLWWDILFTVAFAQRCWLTVFMTLSSSGCVAHLALTCLICRLLRLCAHYVWMHTVEHCARIQQQHTQLSNYDPEEYAWANLIGMITCTFRDLDLRTWTSGPTTAHTRFQQSIFTALRLQLVNLSDHHPSRAEKWRNSTLIGLCYAWTPFSL